MIYKSKSIGCSILGEEFTHRDYVEFCGLLHYVKLFYIS